MFGPVGGLIGGLIGGYVGYTQGEEAVRSFVQMQKTIENYELKNGRIPAPPGPSSWVIEPIRIQEELKKLHGFQSLYDLP